jgi:hypothetical protein
MSEYQTEGDFDLSADALWAAIRDFGELSWLPGKPTVSTEGEGPGMIRTIDAAPIPTVREQLDAIDDAERTIHYRIIQGLPMPVSDYSATMQVIDTGGNRSRLRWSCRFEPDGVSEEEAQSRVARMYRTVLRSMKKKLEKHQNSIKPLPGGTQ